MFLWLIMLDSSIYKERVSQIFYSPNIIAPWCVEMRLILHDYKPILYLSEDTFNSNFLREGEYILRIQKDSYIILVELLEFYFPQKIIYYGNSTLASRKEKNASGMPSSYLALYFSHNTHNESVPLLEEYEMKNLVRHRVDTKCINQSKTDTGLVSSIYILSGNLIFHLLQHYTFPPFFLFFFFFSSYSISIFCLAFCFPTLYEYNRNV